MRILEPSFEIIQCPPYEEALRICETAGRVCYKSEDKVTDDSAESFIWKIINRGHHTILEHISATIKFIHNRGFTHELVRHRLASFSQESTRYVNYDKRGVEFIQPYWIGYDDFVAAKITDLSPEEDGWLVAMKHAEDTYKQMIRDELPPQAARGVLPNDLKTEIIMTANVRELRHILRLRSSVATTGKSHPDMIRVMDPLLDELYKRLPIFFQDLVAERISKPEINYGQTKNTDS